MSDQHSLPNQGAPLPADILFCLEAISESVHNCWMAGRLQDGWAYGEKYDHDRKLHPCLVSYDQLPEREKDYDRRTVQCTIQALIDAGFTICAPTKSNKGGESQLPFPACEQIR